MFVLLLPMLPNALWMKNTVLHLHHAAIRDLSLYDYWVCSHVPTTASGGFPGQEFLNYSQMSDSLHPNDFSVEFLFLFL